MVNKMYDFVQPYYKALVNLIKTFCTKQTSNISEVMKESCAAPLV